MSPSAPTAPRVEMDSERRRLRWALALWVAYVVLALAAGPRLSARSQSVTEHYRNASKAWVDGRPVYGEGREHGFLYLPTFAVLYVPFAQLPQPLGATLWRAVNLALLGLGLWHFGSALGGSRSGTFLLVASLMAVGWSSARHGQATLAMAGTMLAAAGALAGRRLGQAAAWCAVGLAIKPLSVVFLLLAAVAWHGLAWRLLAGLLAVALVPFLTQTPTYVAEQWVGFLRMLSTAHTPLDRQRFVDVLSSLQLAGLDLSAGAALLVRAAAGLAAMGLFLRIRRRADVSVATLLLYAFAAAYLLWFSPRTEHNTYALIIPAVGLFSAWAVLQGRRRLALLHAALGVWIWVDHDITSNLTGAPLPWTKPLILAAALATMLWHARGAGWTMAFRRGGTASQPASSA